MGVPFVICDLRFVTFLHGCHCLDHRLPRFTHVLPGKKKR